MTRLLTPAFPGTAPGPVALWVCDRDAGAVVGLDASHVIAARFAVPSPTALAVRRDGQLWVACAVGGEPEGRHEVWLMTQGGRTRRRHEFGALIDLALCGDGALALERVGPGLSRLSLLGEEGLDCELGEVPGGTCIAGDARGWTVVGSQDGSLRAFAPARGGEFPRLAAHRTRLADSGRVEAPPIVDLAPGPEDGQWWALACGGPGARAGGSPGARLFLLDDDLQVLWWAAAGDGATTLVPIRGQERVWLVGGGGLGARRFGPGGRREIPWAGLSMLALGPGVGSADGGVALVSPGALLALGPEGRARPGQGGFDFLVVAGP